MHKGVKYELGFFIGGVFYQSHTDELFDLLFLQGKLFLQFLLDGSEGVRSVRQRLRVDVSPKDIVTPGILTHCLAATHEHQEAIGCDDVGAYSQCPAQVGPSPALDNPPVVPVVVQQGFVVGEAQVKNQNIRVGLPALQAAKSSVKEKGSL